jgi:hypothetical protein
VVGRTGEVGGGRGGGRTLGQRRGEKKKTHQVKKKNTSGREDVHPQNGLNGLILNWCIGGC